MSENNIYNKRPRKFIWRFRYASDSIVALKRKHSMLQAFMNVAKCFFPPKWALKWNTVSASRFAHRHEKEVFSPIHNIYIVSGRSSTESLRYIGFFALSHLAMSVGFIVVRSHCLKTLYHSNYILHFCISKCFVAFHGSNLCQSLEFGEILSSDLPYRSIQ